MVCKEDRRPRLHPQRFWSTAHAHQHQQPNVAIQVAPALQAVSRNTDTVQSRAEQSRILNEISAGFGKMPYLFSYGTLQQEEVQLSTFGR
jgi:hypothetical protein